MDDIEGPGIPSDTPIHTADWTRFPPSIARHQGPMYQQDETTLTVGGGQFSATAAAPFERQPGFPVHSMIVDNYSNQWVWLGAAVDRFIPPNTFRAIIRIIGGLDIVHAEFTAPPGQNQAAAVNGQICKLAWYEAWLPDQSGLKFA